MRKFAILFLCQFFLGCYSQPKIIPVKLQAEELEVIKETFPQDYCCKMDFFDGPRFPPKGWHQTKNERQKLKKLRDSVNRLKPVSQIWFVKDTLYNPSKLISSEKYYYDRRNKLDTTFSILEKSLFTAIYPKQQTRLGELTIGNQIFKPIDSAKKSTQAQKHFAIISRVAINLKHDKACYFFAQSFIQPHFNNWSEAEMIFAEKRHGKWHLVLRKLYGIT